MGSQQLLLLVLGTIVVAIAIAVGISQFRAYHTETIGDQIQVTLQELAAEAKVFYMKPKTLGGGGGTFVGFSIPKKLSDMGEVTYSMSRMAGDRHLLLGGKTSTGAIQAVFGYTDNGFSIMWMGSGAYTGRKTGTVAF